MNNIYNSSSQIEDKSIPPKITLRSKGKLLLLEEPWVMGILNVTPDSFFSGSRVQKKGDEAVLRAEKMILEGAKIIDIGGYSSRPGATPVSVEEEMDRTLFVIEKIKLHFPDCLVSIDTFRASVAKSAVSLGADFVNDISAGELDSEMLETVGKLSVPFIAMHMRGNPQSMQDKTSYENIILEIVQFFSKKLNECKKAGINDVIIDPGFGFSKTLQQNYYILKKLSYFKTIHVPILVGLSRKSMIYKTLGCTSEEALNGTSVLNMVALTQGANILRVHDVKEAVQTVKLYKQLYH